MAAQLTAGSIERILTGKTLDNAVLQILGYKKIPGHGNDRYRLLINDGVTIFPFGILATTLNHMIVNKKLEKFTIVRLNKYLSNQIQPEKRVIIFLDFDILISGIEVGEKITTNDLNFSETAVYNFDDSEQNLVPTKSVRNFVNDSSVNQSAPNTSSFQQTTTRKAESIGRTLQNAEKKPFIHLPNQKSTFDRTAFQGSFQQTTTRDPECLLPQTVQSVENRSYSSNGKHAVSGTPFQCSARSALEINSRFSHVAPVSSHNPIQNVHALNSVQISTSSRVLFGESSIFANTMPPVQPIVSINPYQNRWTVKSRVIHKTPIRRWSNTRGEGKLFSVTLIDNSGEIRGTAFNECVDKFYDFLQINKVYYISKAFLHSANKAYTSIKNDFEMRFSIDTNIIPCEDNASNIPNLQFDFIPLRQLEQIPKDSLVDIIGVCRSVSDTKSILMHTTKREILTKNVHLVDKSGIEIDVTLWGSVAENFEGKINSILAIKNAKVSTFNGCSLNVINSSTILINPDFSEAHTLKHWYITQGYNSYFNTISIKGNGSNIHGGEWKTFAQVNAESLDVAKADYFTTKAMVVAIRKETCMYQACPAKECYKKVMDMNNGLYKCNKYNRDYDSFQWRLLVTAKIADFSESQWVTCFQEPAETLLAIGPQELNNIKGKDKNSYEEILCNANFKVFVFKLRSKMEVYNETNRMRTVVVTANPLQPLLYAVKLLSDIKKIEKVL